MILLLNYKVIYKWADIIHTSLDQESPPFGHWELFMCPESYEEHEFARLSWHSKLSESDIIINDTHLCEDANGVNAFSIMIENDKQGWIKLNEAQLKELRGPGG